MIALLARKGQQDHKPIGLNFLSSGVNIMTMVAGKDITSLQVMLLWN
jgi:hypothetical protein